MYSEIDRTVSSFNVSIGTGLALETLFEPISTRYDNKRVIPYDGKIDINTYNYHFINIFTILRNIIQSIPSTYKINNEELIKTLLLELNTLQQLYSNTKCHLVVYLIDYKHLVKYLLKSRKYTNKTYVKNIDLLKAYNTIATLIGEIRDICDMIVIGYKYLHKIRFTKALITTHIPYDICNVNLELLESFTGIIKKYHEFSNKYIKIGKDYNMTLLPYNDALLLIFGDKTITQPMDRDKRIEVYDYAINKWNITTSELTIRSTLINKFKLHII